MPQSRRRALPRSALLYFAVPSLLRGGHGHDIRVTTPRHAPAPTMMSASPPVKERVVAPQKQTLQKTKQPSMYRVFIYNDPFNKRERVIDVLLKTCQGLTFSRAYAAMQEAHENGRGLVIVVAQEIAEHYCACINNEGVLSTIEPDN